MRKKKNRFLAGIFILTILINLLSWNSRSFCDYMRKSVFFVMQYAQGHISSLFPFSIGEFMLIAALFLGAAALFFGAAFLAEGIRRKKESGIYRLACGYLYVFLWIAAVVFFIMSTNCFVLYHCSGFGADEGSGGDKEYTVRELVLVRDYVIRRCNELAPQMARDEHGHILYEKDMEKEAVSAMKKMGEQYPLLAGYYPDPKSFTFSGFFSQQYIMGYYFPFSMEANYNGKMYIANVPVTLCHELSHVKGFMYEYDANFIGYLACISSEDIFFQYSGYLSVVDYLNRDLLESLGNSKEAYQAYIQCSQLAAGDNVFLTEEAWEEVESRAVFDTETVKQASRSFLETNMQLNGVEEGMASYGEVVGHLLEYYDGILYGS